MNAIWNKWEWKQKMIWKQTLPIPFSYCYLCVEKMLTSFSLVFSGIRLVLEFLSHTKPKQAWSTPLSLLFLFSQCIHFIYSNCIHLHFPYLFHSLHKQWHDKRSKDEYTWLFEVLNLIKIKNGSAESKREKKNRSVFFLLYGWVDGGMPVYV